MSTEQWLEWISTVFNRSIGQTEYLYSMMGRDIKLLIELEMQIKNNHIKYCPNTGDQIWEIMNMKPKKMWFTLPTIHESNYFYQP